jgi:hypothetical protein
MTEVSETHYRIAMAEAYARAVRENDCGMLDPEADIKRFTDLALGNADDHKPGVDVLRMRMQSRLLGTPAFDAIPKLFTEG